MTASLVAASDIQVDSVLALGQLNGAYEFSGIRDVEVDEAGDIYVVDAFEACARVLSRDGQLLRQVGRRGQGPGECVRPSRLALAGDTLFIIDGAAIHAFVDTSYVKTTRANAEFEREIIFAERLDHHDRGLTVTTLSKLDGQRGPNSLTVRQLNLGAGTLGPPLVRLSLPKMYSSGGQSWAAPLTPVPVVAVSSTGDMYMSNGDSFRITKVGSHGDVLLKIVGDAPPIPASDADVNNALEYTRSSFKAMGTPLRDNAFKDTPRPKVRPVIGKMIVSSDGRLLVQRLDIGGHPTNPKQPSAWVLMNSDGSIAGQFTIGASFTPYSLQQCLLTGVRLSEFDTPYVVQFRLRAQGTGSSAGC